TRPGCPGCAPRVVSSRPASCTRPPGAAARAGTVATAHLAHATPVLRLAGLSGAWRWPPGSFRRALPARSRRLRRSPGVPGCLDASGGRARRAWRSGGRGWVIAALVLNHLVENLLVKYD